MLIKEKYSIEDLDVELNEEDIKMYFRLPRESEFFGGLSMCDNDKKCESKFSSFCWEYYYRKVMISKSRSGYLFSGIDSLGKSININIEDSKCCMRPLIDYSKIARLSKICSNDINENVVDPRMIKDYFEIEYGEYPQIIVDTKTSKNLYDLNKNNKLIYTGKNYLFFVDNEKKSFKEYYYEGRKFIKIDFDWFFKFILFSKLIDNVS